MEDPSREPDRFEVAGLMTLAMRYSSVALQFGIALLIFGYVGHWLDERYRWSPWGILTGILLGMGVGLWNMIRQLERIERSQKADKSKSENSRNE